MVLKLDGNLIIVGESTCTERSEDIPTGTNERAKYLTNEHKNTF